MVDSEHSSRWWTPVAAALVSIGVWACLNPETDDFPTYQDGAGGSGATAADPNAGGSSGELNGGSTAGGAGNAPQGAAGGSSPGGAGGPAQPPVDQVPDAGAPDAGPADAGEVVSDGG